MGKSYKEKNANDLLEAIKNELTIQKRLAGNFIYGSEYLCLEFFISWLVSNYGFGYLFVTHGPYNYFIRSTIGATQVPPGFIELNQQLMKCHYVKSQIKPSFMRIEQELCPSLSSAVVSGVPFNNLALPKLPFSAIPNPSNAYNCAEFIDKLRKLTPHADWRNVRQAFIALFIPATGLMAHYSGLFDFSKVNDDIPFSDYTEYYSEMAQFLKGYCTDIQQKIKSFTPSEYGITASHQMLHLATISALTLLFQYVSTKTIKHFLPKSLLSNRPLNIDLFDVWSSDNDKKSNTLKELKAHTEKMRLAHNDLMWKLKPIFFILLPVFFVFLYISFSSAYLTPEVTTGFVMMLFKIGDVLKKEYQQYIKNQQWLAKIGPLEQNLKKLTDDISTEWYIVDGKGNDQERCEFVLTVRPAFGVTLAEIMMTLTTILPRHGINTLRTGKRFLRFSPDTVLAAEKVPEIKKQILAYALRLKQIGELKKQLESIAPPFEFMSFLDATEDLPVSEIRILKNMNVSVELLSKIFPNNSLSDHAHFVKMNGWHMGEASLLSTFSKKTYQIPSLPSNIATLRRPAGAARTSTFHRHQTAAAINNSTNQISPTKTILITWPSGACYDSSDNTCLIKPISSNFLAENSNFVIFELHPNEFNSIAEYQAFKDKTEEARFTQGKQGLSLWKAHHTFTKYSFDPTGRPVSKKQMSYNTSLKTRLTGHSRFSDGRCYAYAEAGPNGALLHHVIEFDPFPDEH